jgi:hypothetical protein
LPPLPFFVPFFAAMVPPLFEVELI